MKMKKLNTAEANVDNTTIEVQSDPTTDEPSIDQNKISNLAAAMHMIKSTIGGGFLSMPEAFCNSGLIVGTFGIICFGAAVLNTMTFIVRCSQTLRSGKYAAMILADEKEDDTNDSDEEDKEQPKITNKNKGKLLKSMDYPDTVAAVFKYGARGHFASWASLAKKFTTISLILTYYGVNIVYVCLAAEQTKQIIDQFTADGAVGTWSHTLNDLSLHLYPSVIALLIVPMGMIRLNKYLLLFSMIANGLMSVGTIAIFYFIFTDDNGRDTLSPEEHAKWVVWPIARWTLFAGSALCSVEGVGMLMNIENSMKKPLQLAGPPAYTLHWSMLIIVLLNGTLGFFGYIRYGERSLSSVPLNLPKDNRLSEAVKLVITLGILMTYSLHLNVTSDLVWQWLQKRYLKKSTKIKTESSLEYKIMQISLIIGTVFLATAFPDAGPMISIVGSTGFSILGLILPAIMETVWHWYPEDDSQNVDCREGSVVQENFRGLFVFLRHIKNVILIMLAMCAIAGGIYYNSQNIIR